MKKVFKNLMLTALVMVLFPLLMSLAFIPSSEPGVTNTVSVLKDTITLVMPSVVFIKGYTGEYERPFYGSGFIVNDNTIMTAGHCIPDDLVKMEIFTVTKRLFLAKSWRSDPDLDCGVVTIEGEFPEGTACKIAKYGDYTVGDDCFAIGSPYRLKFVVTKGIVSSIGVNRPKFGEPLIVTNFLVDPGYSGGPVFNMQGKVIGIVVGYYGSWTIVVPILSAIEELNYGR